MLQFHSIQLIQTIQLMKGDTIKIIDYRNARYQGQISDGAFSGTGILMDEDFTFCLAYWKDNLFHGPVFAVLPDQKIFYGEFTDNEFNGFSCYYLGAQCQIYFLARNGRIENPVAAVFPLISSVLKLTLGSNEQISTSQESLYQNIQHKWDLVGSILGLKVPPEYRNVRKFVKKHLLSRSPHLDETLGSEYVVGFKDGGLKVRMSLQEMSLKEMGIYDQNNILQTMGKKVINRIHNVKEEGLYNEINGLERYQERDKKMRKKFRDFFRKSLKFQNRFIKLAKLEEAREYFDRLKANIKDNTTQRIAQQLIENPKVPGYQIERSVRGRQRGVSQDEVSLDKIKEQLNKSVRKNKSRSRSPYKQYSQPPAELKYNSNSISQIVAQSFLHDEEERNRRRPHDAYQRYPIEDDYRPRNRDKPMRSPISHDRRQYQFSQLNPEHTDKFPDRIYANVDVAEHQRGYNEGRTRSPHQMNTRNYTRLDKMSDMYDQLQVEERSAKKNKTTSYKSPIKRDYHLRDEENMYERKMGMGRTSRKMEYRDRNYQEQNRYERVPGYVHHKNY